MLDDDASLWKLAIAEPVTGTIAVVAARQQSLEPSGFRLVK